MKRTSFVAGVAMLAVMSTGPAIAADVVIGVPNWPTVNATAHILKHVIEDNLGLEVELQNGANPIIFEGMDKGAIHVHPEVWLPNQQNLYEEYVTERGTVVGTDNVVPAVQGICVPEAFAAAHDLNAVEDITNPDISPLFDSNGDGRGEFWIGAPGWASTNIERVRAKSYGYDQVFDLSEIDETLAYADLGQAVSAGEGWIGFCYSPHYVLTLYDIRMLEEPEHDPSKWTIVQPTDDSNWLENSEAGVAWPEAYASLYYAKAIGEEYPDVKALLDNVDLTAQDLSDMAYALVIENEDPEEFAEKWTSENDDRVLGWLGN